MGSKPEYCSTEGCYREPDLLAWVGQDITSDEPQERWKCEPCWNALYEGATTGTANEIEVLRRAE